MLNNFLRSLIPDTILQSLRKRRDRKQFEIWRKNGNQPPAPHLVKQNIISAYRDKYGIEILIETGTYFGDMVEAQKARFKKIVSIELGADLYQKAKNRFKSDPNVSIIHGNSGKKLPEVVANLSEPAIFWLDGHYSGGITAKGDLECPILEEIDSILSGNNLSHVLLIDDARCFIGEKDYPTIEALAEFVKNKNPKYRMEVKDDVIRFSI